MTPENKSTDAASVTYLAPLRSRAEFPDSCNVRVVSIYDYWDSRRGERSMPRRADIDPIDLPGHLPGLLLIDVEGEDARGRGIFRYRVVGTREVLNRQFDPTGRLVEDGYFAKSKDDAIRSYDSVCHHRAAIFEKISFHSTEGIPIKEDSVMLPLSDNGSEVSQILVFSEEACG
jgi:hypothetical protein